MRNNVLLLILTLFIVSCSFHAGTGHEGEAKVAGVLLDSENNPVENCTLTIARDSYIPEYQSDARGKTLLKPQKIAVGSGGRFAFEVYEDDYYTISGTKEDEILYMTGIAVGKNDKELGSIQLSKSIEVKVYPWWESEKDSNYIAIKGSDWLYNIASKGLSKMVLPEGNITLYHYGDKSIDTLTVEVKEGMVIGDSLNWGPPTIKIEDKAILNKPVELYIDSYEVGDVYHVNWGDFSDTIYKEMATHIYKKIESIPTKFTIEVIKIGIIDSLILGKIIDTDTSNGDWDKGDWDIDSSKTDWDKKSPLLECDNKDSLPWGKEGDTLNESLDSLDYWKGGELAWWKKIDEKDNWLDSVYWFHEGPLDTTSIWYKKSVARKTIEVYE